MEDFLRQIGDSKSVATISFPETRAALQYYAGHGVVSKFRDGFPPCFGEPRTYFYLPQWRKWHGADQSVALKRLTHSGPNHDGAHPIGILFDPDHRRSIVDISFELSRKRLG